MSGDREARLLAALDNDPASVPVLRSLAQALRTRIDLAPPQAWVDRADTEAWASAVCDCSLSLSQQMVDAAVRVGYLDVRRYANNQQIRTNPPAPKGAHRKESQ